MPELQKNTILWSLSQVYKHSAKEESIFEQKRHWMTIDYTATSYITLIIHLTSKFSKTKTPNFFFKTWPMHDLSKLSQLSSVIIERTTELPFFFIRGLSRCQMGRLAINDNVSNLAKDTGNLTDKNQEWFIQNKWHQNTSKDASSTAMPNLSLYPCTNQLSRQPWKTTFCHWNF